MSIFVGCFFLQNLARKTCWVNYEYRIFVCVNCRLIDKKEISYERIKEYIPYVQSATHSYTTTLI